MNKAILSLAILASVSMGLSASNAHKAKNGARERKSPMKELNLTEDQQAKMKKLHENYEVKRKDLSEAYSKDVEKILTPEQKTKWESIQKVRAERRADGHKGGKRGNRGTRAKVAQSEHAPVKKG